MPPIVSSFSIWQSLAFEIKYCHKVNHFNRVEESREKVIKDTVGFIIRRLLILLK
jgi:hypothetical protein